VLASKTKSTTKTHTASRRRVGVNFRRQRGQKMENKKNLTKAQQTMLNNYNKSELVYLWQAYDNYSRAKAVAMNTIIAEMDRLHGYAIRITSYSKNFFTCAYLIDDNNGTKLVYHTPTKRHEFYI